MNARVILVVAVIALSQRADSVSVKVASLPKSIEICKRTDDVCLLRSTQKTIKFLKSGLPKLGLFPVDPLQISEMIIAQGASAVSAQLDFTNQLLSGVSNVIVKHAKGEFTNSSMRMVLRGDIPLLTLNGDYVVSGKILILPIQGVGKNTISLDDVDAELILTGHVIKKDNEDYIEMDNLVLKLHVVKRLHIHLSNLFKGDKALGDNMNKFLNENWSVVWDELRASFEQALGDVFLQVASRVYSKVPYKNIHRLT